MQNNLHQYSSDSDFEGGGSVEGEPDIVSSSESISATEEEREESESSEQQETSTSRDFTREENQRFTEMQRIVFKTIKFIAPLTQAAAKGNPPPVPKKRKLSAIAELVQLQKMIDSLTMDLKRSGKLTPQKGTLIESATDKLAKTKDCEKLRALYNVLKKM